MDLIVPVSWGECSSETLLPATANAAYAILRDQGCVVLRGVFSARDIDALYREYMTQCGGLDERQMAALAARPGPKPYMEVGEGRYEISARMTGAFGAPKLFANRLLWQFLVPLLGNNLRLSGFTIIVSHPGAALQHIHRDHPLLFPELGAGIQLPAYAINVSIPLIDVDIGTGPTGVWPGSHKWAESVVPPPETLTPLAVQRGDCVLLDYRTLHTGMPNRSTRARPLIYMTYTRTWFFDEINHISRTALNMSLETFLSLPNPIRRLVMRVYSQAMRAQQQNEWAGSGPAGPGQSGS